MSQRDCIGGCRCRPGRPNCRASRAKWDKPCQCDGYHYPHRVGSALCKYDSNGVYRGPTKAMLLLMYGPGDKTG